MAVDPRNGFAASIVSDLNGYYDSQNVVAIPGGGISCIFHHTHSLEGAAGLRLYHTRSFDRGKTWS